MTQLEKMELILKVREEGIARARLAVTKAEERKVLTAKSTLAEIEEPKKFVAAGAILDFTDCVCRLLEASIVTGAS